MSTNPLLLNHIYVFRCLATAGAPGTDYFLFGDIYNRRAVLVDNALFLASFTVGVSPWDHESVTLRQYVADDKSYYLDAVTAEDRVALAPTNVAPYSGTKWSVSPTNDGGDTCFIQCVDNKQYLDGRTADNSIGLSKVTADANPAFSGTRWQYYDLGALVSPALAKRIASKQDR